MGHGDDRGGQRGIVGILMQLAHEGAVDFDAIDREATASVPRSQAQPRA
jgi:hypothetical protein